MEKEIELLEDKIRVFVKLTPWKPGFSSKRRFYSQDALALAEEAYPDEKIIGIWKSNLTTLTNYREGSQEGEWFFKIEKKTKKKAKKEVSQKITETEKEEKDLGKTDKVEEDKREESSGDSQ